MMEKILPAPSPFVFSDEVMDKADVCPSACVQEFERISTTSAAQVQIKPSAAPVIQKQTAEITTPRIVYIPLGIGSTTSNEWEDIAGAEAWVNTNDYSKNPTVYFEAGIRVSPNGEVYARLYNVTDKHPVWNSEVKTSSGKSVTVESQNIFFDAGKKLYRVQIKSTLQYPANLDSSRIRIEQH